MATKYGFDFAPILLLLFVSIAVVTVNGDLLPNTTSLRIVHPSKFFNVINYGAVADARTDNSQAFLRAWRDACAYQGKSGVWIPKGTFALDSISFVGPCNGPTSFVIKGTLLAPRDPSKFFTNSWIGFRYVDFLTVAGGGYLDGQGASAWQYNDCRQNSECQSLPASLRFDFVRHSRIHHLRSVNSKNTHINIFACYDVNITNVRLNAPQDSPNTDGIRIGTSIGIRITDAVIATGDDCVCMVSGSRNVDISGVSCGPGHGISIGSLGKNHEQDYVSDITVRNSTFIGSDNGVRIKTWAPSLYSRASDITFEDIVMINVHNPIVIDQQYCPFTHCLAGQSAVQVENVTFKNIWGTSSTPVAVNIQCSGALPCRNVQLVNINLAYGGRGRKAAALCSHVLGSSYGIQNPSGCL